MRDLLKSFRDHKIIWNTANQKINQNIRISGGDINGRSLTVEIQGVEGSLRVAGYSKYTSTKAPVNPSYSFYTKNLGLTENQIITEGDIVIYGNWEYEVIKVYANTVFTRRLQYKRDIWNTSIAPMALSDNKFIFSKKNLSGPNKENMGEYDVILYEDIKYIITSIENDTVYAIYWMNYKLYLSWYSGTKRGKDRFNRIGQTEYTIFYSLEMLKNKEVTASIILETGEDIIESLPFTINIEPSATDLSKRISPSKVWNSKYPPTSPSYTFTIYNSFKESMSTLDWPRVGDIIVYNKISYKIIDVSSLTALTQKVLDNDILVWTTNQSPLKPNYTFKKDSLYNSDVSKTPSIGDKIIYNGGEYIISNTDSKVAFAQRPENIDFELWYTNISPTTPSNTIYITNVFGPLDKEPKIGDVVVYKDGRYIIDSIVGNSLLTTPISVDSSGNPTTPKWISDDPPVSPDYSFIINSLSGVSALSKPIVGDFIIYDNMVFKVVEAYTYTVFCSFVDYIVQNKKDVLRPIWKTNHFPVYPFYTFDIDQLSGAYDSVNIGDIIIFDGAKYSVVSIDEENKTVFTEAEDIDGETGEPTTKIWVSQYVPINPDYTFRIRDNLIGVTEPDDNWPAVGDLINRLGELYEIITMTDTSVFTRKI